MTYQMGLPLDRTYWQFDDYGNKNYHWHLLKEYVEARVGFPVKLTNVSTSLGLIMYERAPEPDPVFNPPPEPDPVFDCSMPPDSMVRPAVEPEEENNTLGVLAVIGVFALVGLTMWRS